MSCISESESNNEFWWEKKFNATWKLFFGSYRNGPFKVAFKMFDVVFVRYPKKGFLQETWLLLGRAGWKDLNFVFFVTVFVFDKCDFWWEWAGRKRPWSGHFSTGHRSGANIILPCFDIFKKSIFLKHMQPFYNMKILMAVLPERTHYNANTKPFQGRMHNFKEVSYNLNVFSFKV